MKLSNKIEFRDFFAFLGSIGISGIAFYQIMLRDIFAFPPAFQYMCSALCAMTVIYAVAEGQFSFSQKEYRLLIAFHFYMLVAAVFSPKTSRSFGYWVNYSMDYINMFCIIALLGMKKDCKIVIYCIGIAALLMVCFLLFVPGMHYGTLRIRLSENMNTNYLGMIIAFGVWMLCYSVRFNLVSFLLCTLCCVSSATAVMMTGSRKALIVIGFIFTFYILHYFFSSRAKMKTTIIILFILLGGYTISILTTAFNNNAISGRFTDSFSGDTDQVRITLYQYGWNIFLRNPLLGYGYQGFMFVTGAAYSHSNIMEVLVSGGIIGSAVYYSAFIYLFKRLFNNRRVLTKRISAAQNDIRGYETTKHFMLRYKTDMIIVLLAVLMVLSTVLIYIYSTLYHIIICILIAESYSLEEKMNNILEENHTVEAIDFSKVKHYIK